VAGVLVSVFIAALFAFISLIPKGTHFSKTQLDKSKEEIKRLVAMT
jgi:hypothetical protein